MRANHLKNRPGRSATAVSPWLQTLPVSSFAPLCVLIIVTVLAYAAVASNSFVDYDDREYVTANPLVQHGLSRPSILAAFVEFHASNWHPLTWLSHMTDVQVFGISPKAHHLVNLALHVVNTVLLFGWLWYATSRRWLSFFVAAAFALHPLHVESVAWVAERKDLLSTFFGFGAIWTYVWYARSPKWSRYACVAVLMSLSLMSKPMLVTLPLVLLLMDYWPLQRLEWRWGSLGRAVADKLPLAAISVGSALITLMAQRGAAADSELVNLPSRISNAAISYGRYVFAMFWPADLAVFYPHPHKALWRWAMVSLLFLAAVTTGAVWLSGKKRYLLMGWLWYIITLIPVIGFVQVGDQSHADRYTYIPLVGLFIALVWGVADWLETRPELRKACLVGAAVLFCLLGVLTALQVRLWKDSPTLFRRAIAVTKDNQTMMTSLGVYLMDHGDLEEARKLLQEAVAIRPEAVPPRYNLGMLYVKMGRPDAGAEEFRRITTMSDDENSWVNLANCMLAMQKPDNAEEVCRNGLKKLPKVAELHFNLGVALSEQGRKAEGAEEVRKALSLGADRPETYEYMKQVLRTMESGN
jgi:protein O-mannosyl-transferase